MHSAGELDRAAATTAAYLDKLQQANGLFPHAPDSCFYWSRGNGWFAAGMAELLRELPADRPRRARVLEGYRTMMAALRKYQGEDGLRRQLIDRPDFGSETSGTGLFTFAMATGVKNGWLDAMTYGPVARKAWLGMLKCLDADTNVHGVCDGTNTAAKMVGLDPKVQREYYRARRRPVGHLHGITALLLSASAFMR